MQYCTPDVKYIEKLNADTLKWIVEEYFGNDEDMVNAVCEINKIDPDSILPTLEDNLRMLMNNKISEDNFTDMMGSINKYNLLDFLSIRSWKMTDQGDPNYIGGIMHLVLRNLYMPSLLIYVLNNFILGCHISYGTTAMKNFKNITY